MHQQGDGLSPYQKLTSLLAYGSGFLKAFFRETTLVDVRVILLVEDDKIYEYIHPHIELETLRARVFCIGMDNVVVLFPLSNNDTQTKVQIDRTLL
jgi:hypothetical protein